MNKELVDISREANELFEISNDIEHQANLMRDMGLQYSAADLQIRANQIRKKATKINKAVGVKSRES